MRTFIVNTEGQNRLGIRELCQRYVDLQWVAEHFTDEQAAEVLLDQFRRAVLGELSETGWISKKWEPALETVYFPLQWTVEAVPAVESALTSYVLLWVTPNEGAYVAPPPTTVPAPSFYAAPAGS